MTTELVIPEAGLPIWMRQARRGLDWGSLIVLCFAIFIARPFILNEGLPPAVNYERLAMRTYEVATAMQDGILYPRWSAWADSGYGAPIPHFSPPATSYLIALITVLITDDITLSIRLFCILCYCAIALSVYALITRHIGSKAGIIGTLTLLTAPPVAITIPFITGELHLLLGLALFTSFLWALDRISNENSPTDGLYLSGLATALLLTDPRFMGLALPPVFLLITRRMNLMHYLTIGLYIILGVGIAAFFWLPALGESQLVTWRPDILIPLSQTFDWRTWFDISGYYHPEALVSIPQHVIGSGQIILLAGALPILWRYRSSMPAQNLLALFAIVLLWLGAGTIQQTAWLLGVLAFCVAFSVPAVLQWVTQPRRARIWFGVCIIIIIASATPIWLYRGLTVPLETISPETFVQYEQLGYGFPNLPLGEQAPIIRQQNSTDERSWRNTFLSGDRNQLAGIPNVASSDVIEQRTQRTRYLFRLRQPGTITLNLAYFPGWAVYVNNRPATVQPAPNSGLTQVSLGDVTSGELEVRFEARDLRQASWALSGISLAILVLVARIRWLRPRLIAYRDLDLLSVVETRLAWAIMLCLLVFLILAHFASLAPNSGRALNSAEPARYRTDAGLELIAYALQPAWDNEYELRLFWNANRLITEHLRIQIIVRDVASDAVLYTSIPRSPGEYPTRRWGRNAFVEDQHFLSLPTSTSTQRFIISLEVFQCGVTCADRRSITFFDERGGAIGRLLTLPRVIVRGS